MCDFLRRIIEVMQELEPSLTDEIAREIERSLEQEFAGESVRIRKRGARWEELKLEVRRRFNGRNATEIARELGIGRTTVYRILKTGGK